AVAEDLVERGDTTAVHRRPGESPPRWDRARFALVRIRHLLRRRASGELPDVLVDLDGRLARQSRHPAPGVPLRSDTPARVQSRLLPQCRCRSAARPRHAVHERGRACARLPRGPTAHRRGRAVHSDLESHQCDRRAALARRLTPQCHRRLPGAQRRAATRTHYPLRFSSSERASARYGELGCWSTICVNVFFASSVLPFWTYARASSIRIASTGKSSTLPVVISFQVAIAASS